MTTFTTNRPVITLFPTREHGETVNREIEQLIGVIEKAAPKGEIIRVDTGEVITAQDLNRVLSVLTGIYHSDVSDWWAE